jgi:drug/metabolite transporter (DMT)-like permease
VSGAATRRPAGADGLVPILGASLLFGVMAVCVRAVSDAMPPAQVAFVRFAGALAVLVGTVGRRALRPAAAPIRVLVLRGVFGASAIILWFHGIHHAGAALATVLHSAYPVFAALFAATLLGERLTPATAAALALNVTGAAVVVGDADFEAATTRGALASLAAAVLAGAAVTTARHLRARESATVVTTWFMLTGTVMSAPALALGLPCLSAGTVAGLVAIVLTSTGAQWLLHEGLGTTTAARASLAAATNIVVASSLEVLALGAEPSARLLGGGGLMVTAVALVGRAHDGHRPDASATLSAVD